MFNRSQNHKILFGFFLIWLIACLAVAQGNEIYGSSKTPIPLSGYRSGIIKSTGSLKAQSSVGGRVAVIHVDENQNVTKGQLLLTLKMTHRNGNWWIARS